MNRPPRDLLERLRFFHREVESLFRRLFQDQLAPGPLEGPAVFPLVDVVEQEDEILVRADLPGVSKESLELYGAANFLVVRGVKPPPERTWKYLRVERTFGAFQRMVVLPAPGDPSRVTARFDRGVLEVRIPKVNERRRTHRQIPIE